VGAARPLPCQLQFFHPGGILLTGRAGHEVGEPGRAAHRFLDAVFDYGKNKPGLACPRTLGFAGLRCCRSSTSPANGNEPHLLFSARATSGQSWAGTSTWHLGAPGWRLNSGPEPGGEEFSRCSRILGGFFSSARRVGRRQRNGLRAAQRPESVAGAYRFVIYSPGPTHVGLGGG